MRRAPPTQEEEAGEVVVEVGGRAKSVLSMVRSRRTTRPHRPCLEAVTDGMNIDADPCMTPHCS